MTDEAPVVVALGEILWDLLPEGPKFGGAPANFAHHASSLGANVKIVSAVGNDPRGVEAIEILKGNGIDVAHVAVHPDKPTGAVDVSVDAKGHASYQFRPDDAWDHLQWSDSLAQLASRTDGLCFGTLGQRSESSATVIERFVRATPEQTLRLCDVNLRPPHDQSSVIRRSLEICNAVKINDDELAVLAESHGFCGSEVDRAEALASHYALRLVAVTRGERGGLLLRGDEVSEVAAQPVNISDTVGAGDSFTAAIMVGVLKNMDLDRLNRAACRVAEYVCTQSGATPSVPDTLRAQIG